MTLLFDFSKLCAVKSIARSDGIGRRVNSITTVLSVFTVSLQSESHLDVALTET